MLPSSRFLYRPSSISDGFKTITWGQSRSRNMLPWNHHFPQPKSFRFEAKIAPRNRARTCHTRGMDGAPSLPFSPRPPNNSISPKIIARFLDRSPDVNLMSAKSGSIDGSMEGQGGDGAALSLSSVMVRDNSRDRCQEWGAAE